MWGGGWEKNFKKRCNWDVRLRKNERDGERNRGGQFRNVECYISKNGVTKQQLGKYAYSLKFFNNNFFLHFNLF